MNKAKRFGKVLIENGNTTIYYSSIYKIKDISDRYSGNRPPDSIRVNDIKTHIQNKTLIDGIIYVWFSDKKLYIYDGLTRFTAGKLLNNNIDIILSVNFTKNESEITDHFLVLNKSIPLPELYKEVKCPNKEKLEQVVDFICKKYKQCRSGSRKPQKQNFNRDNMIDLLYIVFQNVQTDIISIALFDIIEKVNEEIKNTNILPVPKKTLVSNFYLNMIPDYKLIEMLVSEITIYCLHTL